MHCDLTTCISIESAWVQHLKLKYDKLVANVAYKFNLRPYTKVFAPLLVDAGAGDSFVYFKASDAAGWADGDQILLTSSVGRCRLTPC
jgi:hypothetical protein